MSNGIKNLDFFKLLKKKEEEEGYEATLSTPVINVAKQVEPILGRIPVIFEEYTLHDISHSENVIKNMWKFIPAEVKENLNAVEIYLLILSAYLHDVGMAVSKDEEDEILESEEFQKFRDKHEREVDLIEKYKEEGNTRAAEFYEKQIFRDYIREHHHERSYEYIMHNYSGEKGLKIDNEDHARLVAEICKAHRLDVTDLKHESKFDRAYSLEGKSINLQFLAVCLRLGDTLDADKRRTPKILKGFINPRDPESKEEWDRHTSVPGITITEKKIKINARCKSPRYQRGLIEFLEKLKQEIKYFVELLKDNRPEISDNYYLNLKEVKGNIRDDGTYIYNDFKFSLDKDKIFSLFMGTNLYNENTVGLRELLQNSIDACRCRKAKEAGYEGEISYKLVKENIDEGEVRKIIVEDNGIGMDDHVIENYFMRIGKSYYQSKDFKKEGFPFSPISVFGIGILSCFMLADRIEVETFKKGRKPRKLEIENYSDYFVTREGRRTKPGTEITLFLKDDAKLDLIDELKKYARHVEFPICVDDGENKETIVDRKYTFNFGNYMHPSYKQYEDELKPYVIDFEKEGIEGVKGNFVFMFLKDKSGGYGFKSKNLSKVYASSYEGLFVTEKRGFLSQDGILINKTQERYPPLRSKLRSDILSLFGYSDLIFFDINLKDNSKIDLTLDRNDVVADSKNHNSLNRKIEKIVIDHIEKIFSQKHLVTDKDKNKFMECFFKTFIGYYFHESDSFLKSMKKLIVFECFVKGESKYLRYNELNGSWKHFHYLFTVLKAFRKNTSKNMKKAIEKAYPRDPLVYSYASYAKELPELLREFSGEHIIVTNKELGFSFDKFLLLPPAERGNKKEYEVTFECGCTFEGDYKDCFGTLTTEGFIESINHPFIMLVNKNISTFKGNDKEKHMVLINGLIEMEKRGYLKPLKEIREMQEHLLNFYVEKGVLTKEEAKRHILTEKDFCPYDMGENFLK